LLIDRQGIRGFCIAFEEPVWEGGKMRVKRIKGSVQFAVLMGIGLFASCSAIAQDVTYNVAPDTDFSKFKTYKWVKIEGTENPDQILDGQIKQSIDSQLAAKGFTKTDSDKADLFVGYQVSISQEKQWNAYGGGGVGWRMGGGMATATSSTIQVGTLGFDVYDQAGKQLIWRGAATKTLDPPKDPEKRQKNLDKGVAKLLKNFPPPTKK
jgi:Domain of unknown function (DUF4136)